MARQLLIVGAGNVGRALLEELPDDWEITVVDRKQDALNHLPTTRGKLDVTTILGDATSSLVLQQCKITDQTLVAITTGSDETNVEVAKVTRNRFSARQVICLLDDPERGVSGTGLKNFEIVDRQAALATLIFNRLCVTEVRGVGLGLGQGELVETRILDGSPAAGRPLMELSPQRWLVAAVYRKEQLIVPHGRTVLEVDDRVLLVGEPDVLHDVGRFLRGGEPVFPSQYGPRIGVHGGQMSREEARWLLEHTHAEITVTVDRALLDMHATTDDAATDGLRDLGVGCLVIEPEPIRWTSRVGLTRSVRKRLLLAAHVPVLVARGTTPYRRVLLAVSGDQNLKKIAHVAIDLARQCEAELTVLTVLPPSLSVGEEQLKPLRDVPARVAHIAQLYSLDVKTRHDEGNPIDCIRRHARDFDLLVVGHSGKQRNTLFTPDISLFLLHDTPCSTLFVPWDVSRR